MTLSVIADVPADPHATPSRVPRQSTPEPSPGATIAVTLPPAPGDRATDPAALRALIEHIADVCGLPVVVQFVTADPADIDHPTDP